MFLSDESARVPLSEGVAWRALNETGAIVASGEVSAEKTADLGQPGIGWYRIEMLDANQQLLGFTTAAVLARLAAPVPEDSPVCADGAVSWLAGDETARASQAQLAALAGVNWFRDRLHWREIQPSQDHFEAETRYDTAAKRQTDSGLKLLQVFHTFPKWVLEASPDQDPLCPDLRLVHAFCKAASIRFTGDVLAWEPWNEANIKSFGGWPISAICSFQKTAFLGFKAGNPAVTVCWNPLAGYDAPWLVEGILANESWNYYDTFNIHCYDLPDTFVERWAYAREAACGRPMWVSECDRGIAATEGRDLSPENDVRKAELIAQEYASSLLAGAVRHFHFILGDYMEKDIQFGLLRQDLTPRSGYVALAAVGRFLAGAKCLGRWRTESTPECHAIAFRALPDGVERDVIVAWTEPQGEWPLRGQATAAWRLPETVRIESLADFLGRPLPVETPKEVTSKPIFIVMPSGEADKLPLDKPALSPYRDANPSPIVLQLHWPNATLVSHDEDWAFEQLFQIAPDTDTEVQIFIYNFGDSPATGALAIAQAPSDWPLSLEAPPLNIAPMDRAQATLRLRVSATSQASPAGELVRLTGDFGTAGKPALAFRVKQ